MSKINLNGEYTLMVKKPLDLISTKVKIICLENETKVFMPQDTHITRDDVLRRLKEEARDCVFSQNIVFE